MENDDKIKGVTLRVAIFFGLTTFTLCIAIFYVETILDDTRKIVNQKDSVIQVMKSNMDNQLIQIQENDKEIRVMKDELREVRSNFDENSN